MSELGCVASYFVIGFFYAWIILCLKGLPKRWPSFVIILAVLLWPIGAVVSIASGMVGIALAIHDWMTNEDDGPP